MSYNRCDRCGRPIKDPNAKYGWRCAEIIAAGESLTIDLSAIFYMLEKYTDFSFESQNDLFDTSEIFEKMLTLSSAPYSMKAENDYIEKGISLAYACFPTIMSWETKQGNLPYRILLKKCIKRKKHWRRQVQGTL